jgi:hypothetical protein
MKRIRAGSALALILCSVPALGRADASASETAADRDAAADRQWRRKLGLNADQAARFLAALKAKDAELEPLREQLRAEMRRVQSQLNENAADKDVQETLQRLVRLRRAIAFRNDQFDAGAASFLSPTQRARLFVWRSLNACSARSAENLTGDDLQEQSSIEEVEPE